MNFASDNWAGASAPVSAALAAVSGIAPAYGADDLTLSIERRFCELFDKEVRLFFVSTGSAANVLSLASMLKPGGIVLCHADAHVLADECGALEHTSGGRLLGLASAGGKLTAETVERAAAGFLPPSLNRGRLVGVSLTQATEHGTVYTATEIASISDVARRYGLGVHMDGARFANALATLGASPAETTWKAGIDVLSFGATKNGCWCADVVVLFDPAQADEFAYLHKRYAQRLSKSRFVAAQLGAYLSGGHWLDNARHANAMATRLAAGIVASGRGRLLAMPEANLVFATIAEADAGRLRAAGARFHPATISHAPDGAGLVRLVTSFATDPSEVDRFVEILGN